MKRYRVLVFDFDTRATILAQEPGPQWSQQAKEANERSKRGIIEGLGREFGPVDLDQKVENFKAIKALPISLIAFHNRFFRQARAAFVGGCYYPALTSVCALGERVLNHLILRLREYYRATPEYKTVYRKDSFDDWNVAIGTLVAWGVLLPRATEAFHELREYRNGAIHFNPEIDTNDRSLALDAILKFNDIVIEQFSGFGTQPWYIGGTLGAIFVKKGYEEIPFVKEIVLPNCHKVGHLHLLEMQQGGWVVKDDHDYGDKAISDEEFKDLYNNRKL
jgi:hypothetical protein